MKRSITGIILAGFLVAIIGSGLLYFYTDGYYLPEKPCRPLAYPDGGQLKLEPAKPISFTTGDSIEEVLLFYDKLLEIKPWPAEIGYWQREQLKDANYLYSCYGADSNRITGETGCIYVRRQGEDTLIRTILYRTEGTNIPCKQE
jgi:hypothetical protein